MCIECGLKWITRGQPSFEPDAAVSRMKIDPHHIAISDYTYPLPPERIALTPLPQRDASRLLVYHDHQIEDAHFYQLPELLPAGATIVFNNTRVIEARVLFQKATGGVIEIFCLEPDGQTMETALAQKKEVRWHCLIGGASKWKHGQVLQKKIVVGGEEVWLHASYLEKEPDSFRILFSWDHPDLDFASVLHAAGAIPLPPYIKREAGDADKERYQTVFGIQDGSVAAPTAALHFTSELIGKLSEKNIHPAWLTLHVGAGTFKPVKSETLAGHHMHAEPFSVTLDFIRQLLASEKIIVVGTTSLRTLESLHWLGVKKMHGLLKDQWVLDQWEAYELADIYGSVSWRQSLEALAAWMVGEDLKELNCHTSLIIVPGYPFQMPDALITNFHQPQSTLLLLVCAFIGKDWEKIYRHALEHDYRFLSYGDSNLLWRNR